MIEIARIPTPMGDLVCFQDPSMLYPAFDVRLIRADGAEVLLSSTEFNSFEKWISCRVYGDPEEDSPTFMNQITEDDLDTCGQIREE